MAQNYVEILVKARDQAAPELDDLQRRLDELKHTVAEARATVDDADAAAKLDRLDAQLVMLGKRTANPKIDLAGALKAEAQIHAVEASLDRLQEKADKADAESGGRGLLGKLLFGGGGKDSNGLLSSFGSLPGGAGLGELFTNPYGIAAVGAGIAALLPELLGLASGFSAAGAGAGAFYLLAHPAISNLTQDTQGLLAAEQALQLAQNKYSVDPTKANAKAVQTATDNLKAVQKSMSQDAGGAAAGIVKLREEYDKLTTAFQPDVFKVFNAGLRVLNNLLPLVTPFAATFANVMSGLLGTMNNSLFGDHIERVAKGIHGMVGSVTQFGPSNGFAQFLAQFHGLEGPSLKAIGHGMGEVAVQLGKLLTVMSAKDVVNAINIAFSILSGTIDGLRHAVEGIMRAWDVTSKTVARDAREVATAFDGARHDIAAWSHEVAHIFDDIRHNIATFAHDVAAHFDEIRRTIADFAHNVAAHFDEIRHDIATWVSDVVKTIGGLPGTLYGLGKNAIEGLLHGMESVVGGVINTVAGWGHDIANAIGSPFGIHFSEPSEATQMIKAGSNIARGLAGGMLSGRGVVTAAAAQMTGGIGGVTGGGLGGGVLRIEVTGGGSGLDQVFMTWLKASVRASGGDPRIFTRKVQFA